jgi:hypothetical protein
MPRKKKVVEEKIEFDGNQDKGENFRSEEGKLYLVRCYACEPKYGRENYMPAVASGQCAWCGWGEKRSEIFTQDTVEV